MATHPDVRTDLAAVRPLPSGLFQSRYGSFCAATRSFVINDILTPRPWTNVMSNGRYGLVVSQFGGGFSWLDNSQLGRLTRWEQDLAVDAYGRWMYVYDPVEDEIFSTTFAPMRRHALDEEVVHGLGYTVFRRRHARFETRQTVFVPEGSNCEHWIVEIENLTGRDLILALGSYLEWFLGGQGEWHREFHRLFMSDEAASNAHFAWKRRGLEEGSREEPDQPMVAYAATSGLGQVDWFADKAQWLGREGRLDRPEALLSDEPPVITGRWDDPIAAFRCQMVLEPGEVRRFGFTLGAEETREQAERSASVQLADIEKRLDQAQRFHAQRAGALEIETSDEALDLMANSWLPHQAEVGRIKARCAYYQQGGAYGYRDQLQDSLMLLDTDPATTLRQLGLHAEAMYEDGGVRHWWHPDSPIHAVSRHSDTCLWLAHGVLDYIDETADLAALSKTYRFLNRDSEKLGQKGTLLEHCERGLARFLERRSPRGLPLIGAGDWNDGLSHAGIEGKGETVWLAMFGFRILNRMAEVYDRIGDGKNASKSRAEAESLRQAVESHAWDGEWYIAGTSDEGRPFGSREAKEGQIFLNPQTWAVITGIGAPERMAKAMKSVEERLVKPYGALLLHPAYSQVDPYVGYITRYAPGLRENGGVYSHASTWAVQAFAQIGRPEVALNIFRGMLPSLRSQLDPDRYQAEPYVMPGNVDGPDSPFEGRAGWTWYTGSAAWMRRVALHWLLGVRSTFDGLTIQLGAAELMPARLRRPFRGDVFEIEIERGCRHRTILDGQEVQGPIAASGQGRTRKVHLEAIE